MSGTFTGQFRGECGSCGEETKGTEVVFDQSNTLVHVLCPDSIPKKRAEVCDSCFLEKSASGRCDDCD